MRLPVLRTAPARTKQEVMVFGGINYGDDAAPGEMEESMGLSSARYPYISQRSGRKVQQLYGSATGMTARGGLCVVNGIDLYYKGERVGRVSVGKKQFAKMNTKIIIFPDKVFYDTASGEFGHLEARNVSAAGTVSIKDSVMTLSDTGQIYVERSGERTDEMHTKYNRSTAPVPTFTKYERYSLDKATGAFTFEEPSTVAVDELVIGDIVANPETDTRYNVVTQVTKSKTSVYDKTYGTGYEYTVTLEDHYAEYTPLPPISDLFSAGDAIQVEGSSVEGNNKTLIAREVTENSIRFSENSLTDVESEAGEITLSRNVPDLEYICECDNRIWGTCGQTIYSSALGDPRNFFVYDGVGTDSYAVSVGTEGPFTGCIAFGQSVMFFKEDCCHKILGSLPSEYYMSTYTIPGLQEGSERSLTVVNEVLYYKGRNGVYAMTGSAPVLISHAFGNRKYSNASAGSDGERYYISMQGEDSEWNLFAYDIRRGIWLKEDDTQADYFTFHDGILYFIDRNRVIMTGQDFEEEGKPDWIASFAPITEQTMGRKCYSRILMRMELEEGSWVNVLISCDKEPWRQVWSTHDTRPGVVTAHIQPNRCDSFRIRLVGRGKMVVRSILREYEVGSEV